MDRDTEIADSDSDDNDDSPRPSANGEGDIESEQFSSRDEETEGGSDGPERSAWVNSTEDLGVVLGSADRKKHRGDKIERLPEKLPNTLEIYCGAVKATLHVNKLGQGSRGPCINYGNEWLTPNQFQMLAGRESSKDWKRSIRYRDQTMKWWIDRELLRVHDPRCGCTICSIRQRASRKKKTEILAENNNQETAVTTVTATTSEVTNASDSIYEACPIQQLESSEDTAAGVKFWSDATTTSRPDEEQALPMDAPVEIIPTRKRQYSRREPRDENGIGCEIPTKSDAVVTPSLSTKQDASFWTSFRFDSTSDESFHVSASHVSTSKRIAVDSEDKANGEPSCPVAARVFRVIEESHLPCDPGTWSVEQVSMFIKKVGFAGYSCVFKDSDIDGEALLLLREEHVLNTLGVKLGPALKLFKLIKKLQSL